MYFRLLSRIVLRKHGEGVGNGETRMGVGDDNGKWEMGEVGRLLLLGCHDVRLLEWSLLNVLQTVCVPQSVGSICGGCSF